jgi:cytoskeletal protein CcmA (bactofilin family)
MALHKHHKDTGKIRNPGITSKNRQTPFQLLRIIDDRISIEAAAEDDPNAALADMKALGLKNGKVYGRMVSGQLPISAIGDLENLTSIRFVRPVMAMTRVGLVDSQGDKAMRSDLARAAFGVDGSGVTIGVLSDSYDDLGGAAADVASGDLPGGVVVLDPGPGGGADEGRAMMQLIHDIAPGATQIFHTAFNSQSDFAAGIIELANAGADIIVDDIGYFTEAMFQDDNVAQAVDAVEAMGIPYFSAAANQARDSYESAFAPGTAFAFGAFPADIAFQIPFNIGPFSFFGGTAHDFDPGAGVDVSQSITMPEGTGFIVSFQWDEPFFSISGGAGATNEADIYVLAPAGTLDPVLPTVVGGSTDPNFSGNAVEVFAFINPPGSGITTFDIMIVHDNINFGGLPPGFMKYIRFDIGEGIVLNEFDTKSGTIYGHPNAAGAEAVGAAYYFNTPEFGTSPPIIEPFSSAGGTPILFDIFGSPVAPVIRTKPGFVSPDCTNTTFFIVDVVDPGDGSDTDLFPNFPGTSAAAPHAAAVAALMKQAAPSLSPGEIFDILRSTAIDMDDPFTAGFDVGFDFGTGFGLIDAEQAISAVFARSNLTILAGKGIELKKDASVEGDIHANEQTEHKRGSVLAGNVRAGDRIEIQSGAEITGSARAPEIENKGGTVGAEVIEPVAAMSCPPLPAIGPGITDVEVPQNGSLDLPPGDYREITVGAGATLNLENDGTTGDYQIAKLEIHKSAVVNLDATLGEVNLLIEGGLDLGGTLNAFDGVLPTRRVNIWSASLNVTVNRDAAVNGCNLIAPNANVEFQKGSFFKGFVCAGGVEVQGMAMVVGHNSSATPKAAALLAVGDGLPSYSENAAIPAAYALDQNYPNPFNPTTTIRFGLPEASEVTLKIFNIRGQLVRTLASGGFDAGYHQIQWNATNENGVKVSSGMYFYQIQAKDFQQVKKLLLLK